MNKADLTEEQKRTLDNTFEAQLKNVRVAVRECKSAIMDMIEPKLLRLRKTILGE